MTEVTTGGFRLQIELTENTAEIAGFSGQDTLLSIPESLTIKEKEYPVTKILRKAFLNCRGLREVILPKSLETVGDWAFSQCIHLKKVVIEGERLPVFERGVFEGSERLEEIVIPAYKDDSLSKLLAAAVRRLPAEYLLRDKDIGSKDWYERWDLALFSFLLRDDYEGYSDRALCGEEDISYDGIGSVDGELLGESAAYLKEVGKNKCFLCMLRLMNDYNLSEKDRNRLSVYITDRTIDTKSQHSWYLCKEDYRDNQEFFERYLDIVAPSKEMTDRMLNDLGEDMAQIKAILIRRNAGNNKSDAFFEDLSL